LQSRSSSQLKVNQEALAHFEYRSFAFSVGQSNAVNPSRSQVRCSFSAKEAAERWMEGS
jgi:hypothetical protein